MAAQVILVVTGGYPVGLKTVLLVCDPARGHGDQDSMYYAVPGNDPGGEIPAVTWDVFQNVAQGCKPAIYNAVDKAMKKAKAVSLAKYQPKGLRLLAAKALRALLVKVEMSYAS